MPKQGRPKGSTPKQRAAQRLIAEGMPPLEAFAAAGFADPKRECERQAKVSAELREAAVEAHAELVTTEATVLSGSQMNAVKRLTSVIAYGEDRDAISAARAMHVIAPEVETKQQAKQLVTFISYANGRGPAYGAAGNAPNASGQIHITCDIADESRAIELLMQAVERAQHGLEMHVIELVGKAAAHDAAEHRAEREGKTAPQPTAAAEPEPSTVPPPKRKAAIIPPAPPKPTRTAEEILAHYRSATK